MTKIGLIIPTKGTRDKFLDHTLISIDEKKNLFIVVIAPTEIIENYRKKLNASVDKYVEDDGKGLSASINKAIRALPKSIKYITWLGDDDILIYDNFIKQLDLLENNKKIAATYGKIFFINEINQIFWKLKPKFFAKLLIRIGPNRIPQPGSLVRRSAFEGIGGLDVNLKFAFDTDMFIKLQRIGKLKFINEFVAYFRWHNDSLSAGSSSLSLKEASYVRKKNLTPILSILSNFWEVPQLYLGLKLPNRINLKNQKLNSRFNQKLIESID